MNAVKYAIIKKLMENQDCYELMKRCVFSKEDKDFVLKIIPLYSGIYEFCNEELKRDIDVVSSVLTLRPYTDAAADYDPMEHIPKDIVTREIAIKSLSRSPYNYSYLPSEYQNIDFLLKLPEETKDYLLQFRFNEDHYKNDDFKFSDEVIEKEREGFLNSPLGYIEKLGYYEDCMDLF